MAEPIVRSFVIDTTESEQNLKELNVQINATSTAINQGAQSFDNVAAAEEAVVTSSKSLKAQLRDLQAQLAATEPNSAKYRELSMAAGELKDKIQDAAQAVGTQAGGAFERVGGSLGLVTSRIANLDFEGAAEGAKLLAKNITDIKPGDISKGIQGIGSAFASVGKALLTNPIFLIGAAIAAAIVYADELLSLVDGVTDAETKALDVQKERAALAKQNYDNISATEETLKRQGMTEKEITALKLQALNTAILEQQAVVETTRIQAEGQIKAAERNAQYLKTFLDFVTFPQRKLAEFFQGFVNGSIEVLNKLGLGIEKIDVTSVFEDVNNFVVKQIFDPEAERKNQEKIASDAQKSLDTLINQRDGILNAQEAKEKAARDKANADAKAAADKAADERLKAAEELAKQEEELFDELLKSFEDNEKAKTKAAQDEAEKRAKLAEDYNTELAAIQRQNLLDTLTDNQKEELAVKEKYAKLLEAAKAFNASLKPGEEEQAIDVVAIEKQQGDEILAVKKANAEEDAAITAATEEKKRQEQLTTINQGIELAQQGTAAIQSISDLAFAQKLAKVKKGSKEEEKLYRKQFEFNKKLQLAGAIMDAAKAVTASLSQSPVAIGPLPNPAGIASLILATATGAANVAKIAATKYESPGSTTPSPTPSVSGGGGGGDLGGEQPAQFNPLAAQFINNRPEQVTPRAYVLASDVASAAETRQRVEDLARLG